MFPSLFLELRAALGLLNPFNLLLLTSLSKLSNEEATWLLNEEAGPCSVRLVVVVTDWYLPRDSLFLKLLIIGLASFTRLSILIAEGRRGSSSFSSPYGARMASFTSP